MNLPLRLAGAGLGLLLGLSDFASAQLSFTFDFEGVPSGSLANSFSTPRVSFHQARFVPLLDLFGDPVPNSEHWEIDAANDALFPVTVENPLNYDRGAAPSGENALQALWQPVLISFAAVYSLEHFSVTLDQDSFGLPGQISFINSNRVIGQLEIDPSVPGEIVTASSSRGITGIVLPGGAFYDDVRLTLAPVPVPEPSTYGLFGALALLMAAAARRHWAKGSRRLRG